MSSKTFNFANSNRPAPSRKERLLRLVWNCLPRRGPALDALFSRKLPELHHLPERNPDECIPDFNSTALTIRECPVGPWSTPLIDTVVLVKCAMGFKSRRILEIGSYLGHTAKILAENTPEETRVTTLDEYPEHGGAYRGGPLERRIDRRIGKISLEHFRADEKYDLIFVDADHRFENVLNDSQVALNLLADNGVIVWHDYECLTHFGGMNDVPEVLKIVSQQVPIVSLRRTWLAMYSRHPGWETSKRAENTVKKPETGLVDAWTDRSLRG